MERLAKVRSADGAVSALASQASQLRGGQLKPGLQIGRLQISKESYDLCHADHADPSPAGSFHCYECGDGDHSAPVEENPPIRLLRNAGRAWRGYWLSCGSASLERISCFS